MRRPLALAHLSALQLPPPQLVRCAAAAGFDLVGPLRLTPTRDGFVHPMLGSAPMRSETARVLRDTGLRVLDVEVVRLRADTDVRTAEPLLAAGAELGAGYLLCTVEDDDLRRSAELFAAMCELAGRYGLRCMVEPMIFSALRTPAQAAALLDEAGAPDAGLLIDALHLERAGATPAELDALPRQLLHYAQLCDAPEAGCAPDLANAVAEALSDRLAPGDGVLPLPALLAQLPSGAPVSVEAPNPAGLADAAAWVQHLAARTRTLLATELR